MSGDKTKAETCQVDFYVLKHPSAETSRIACDLALTMWERNQHVYVATGSETACKQIDELMWQHPAGRFLPHALAEDADAGKAMIKISVLSTLNTADVVINLCPETIPQPERFSRILEIVPFADEERIASRVKFRAYRELGLTPRMQEVNK